MVTSAATSVDHALPPADLLAQWRQCGLHGDTDLGQALEAAARAHPDAPLTLSGGGTSRTYRLADLHRQGLALAASLHGLGLRCGDVLAVQLPNSIEGILLQRAAAVLGVVFLPIVPIYGADELRHILCDAQARMLVLPAQGRHSAVELLPALGELPALAGAVVVGGEPTAALPELAVHWDDLPSHASAAFAPGTRGSDDLALLIYTSGTTALPKGVMHSANSLLAESRALGLRRAGAPTPQLSPWPTGHIAGLVVLMDYALHGRPTVLMQRWDAAEAATLVETHGIVASSGTGFHLAALLDAADAAGQALATLRDYLAGAAAVPSSLVQRCVDRGIATYRAYGLSEHPTVTAGRTDDPLHTRLRTEGALTPGNALRVVDDLGQDMPSGQDGELACRGPERFLGYRDASLNHGAFLPGGWFLTGDIGHLDADGFLHLTDRKKDIVNRGGEKISSREVEDALLALPEVAEAAVVGAPDERLGERVCAFIVWRSADPMALSGIARHFEQLGKARQKTPERLLTVLSLPRNAAGKVNKQLLRQQLAQERG